MGAILILLRTAMVNANHAFSGYVDIPALCLFSGGIQGVQFEYNYVIVTISLIFLFSSYITGVVRLFNPLSRQTHKRLIIKPNQTWDLLKKFHCYAASREDV